MQVQNTWAAKFGQILIMTDTRLVHCILQKFSKLMRTDIFSLEPPNTHMRFCEPWFVWLTYKILKFPLPDYYGNKLIIRANEIYLADF